MNLLTLCALCAAFVFVVLLKKWNTKHTKNHEELNDALGHTLGSYKRIVN